MAKTVVVLFFGLAVYFLFGLGSCEPHIPVTVNTDSVAQQPELAQSENPADVGRLQDCSPGTADCDRDHTNGCEATLADDPKNCGVCGTACSVPNAEAGCMGGTCRVIGCSPGYCDDDGEAENGCETQAKRCNPPSGLYR